eukprot:355105-Chlamydomonas_euryale.AAC.9
METNDWLRGAWKRTIGCGVHGNERLVAGRMKTNDWLRGAWKRTIGCGVHGNERLVAGREACIALHAACHDMQVASRHALPRMVDASDLRTSPNARCWASLLSGRAGFSRTHGPRQQPAVVACAQVSMCS